MNARDLRARDEDRNRVVSWLDEAFVDGQINQEDHDRRTEAALSATRLSELDGLVADLQPPSAAIPAARPVTATPRTGAVVAAMVAALAIGGITWAVVRPDDRGDSPSDTPVQVDRGFFGGKNDSPQTTWKAVKDALPSPTSPERTKLALPEVGRWSLTEDKVKALVAGYQEQLGTPYFAKAQLYPEWTSIERPVAGTKPRLETWGYRGTEFSMSRSEDENEPLLDWRDVNLTRLFDNVDYALNKLDVPDAVVLYISVYVFSDEPVINIYVQSSEDDDVIGYLNTTLGGKVLSKHGP